MGPTWGPPGSCRPQMGPMLAPWTLPSGWYVENCSTCSIRCNMHYRYCETCHCGLQPCTSASELILHQIVVNFKHCQPCLFAIWWRHQMETFLALLAICAGNSLVTGHEGQWRGALMFFICALNKQLSKQSWGWWFETQWRPLAYHDVVVTSY